MIVDRFDVLQPIPAKSRRKLSYRLANGLFTPHQCERILEAATQSGRFYRDASYDGKCDIRYLQRDEASWVYEKMAKAFAELNVWQFSLTGVFEAFRILRYRRSDFAGLHNDVNFESGDGLAKLTAIVPLVPPTSWGGGELVIGAESHVVDVPRGSALVFPSFLLHEVSRVTKGERIVLAAWASGPPFV